VTGRHHDRWVLDIGDPEYPEVLRSSPDAPKRLYGIGDPSLLVYGLGIVGARKATPYGLWAAERFGAWAGEAGVMVVSGAALGCDRAAQIAAVEAGGPSVAVLGCGPDVDYPRTSRVLLERLRREGLVVSEGKWGDQPKRWTLQRRNRIIAALSKALLVVEAALPSGTFSTADYALEAGREVLAVPGSIRSRESRGTNRLIQNGAMPVTEVSDLAQRIHTLGLVPEPDEEALRDPKQCPGTTDLLVRTLLADPMRPDDAAWQLGMDIRDVMVRITRLEASGLVARYPDGRYGPAACVSADRRG
jgi:DNA processing protein